MIKNPGANTTNKLVYMGFIGGGQPGNQPPTAGVHLQLHAPPTLAPSTRSTSTDDHGVVSYRWNGPGGRLLGTGVQVTVQYETGR